MLVWIAWIGRAEALRERYGAFAPGNMAGVYQQNVQPAGCGL